MNVGYVVLGVGVLLVLLIAFSYNRFVSQRNLIRNSWSNIDTELRRRYDLIPNLVETVKGYAAHEREVLEQVTEARRAAEGATGSAASQEGAERPFVGALQKLLAVAEAYPDLKADRHFLDLQKQLVLTEDRIQAARRFYNANVQDYNRRIESIPSSLIAWVFRFKEADYFEIEPAVRAEVTSAPDAAF